jgi:hypothetical protein
MAPAQTEPRSSHPCHILQTKRTPAKDDRSIAISWNRTCRNKQRPAEITMRVLFWFANFARIGSMSYGVE